MTTFSGVPGDGPAGAGSSVALPTRTVELDGCHNFRDLGGYRTADGRQTRWRCLFRADGLGRLSAADCAVLADTGLATVVDLRTSDEAERAGRFPVHEVSVRYFDLPLTNVLPHQMEPPPPGEDFSLAGQYLDMLSGGAPAIGRVLALLADDEALPAVFHCSAGKDRTGIISALILAFLGVPDEIIAADYALSAPAMVHIIDQLKIDLSDTGQLDRYPPAIIGAVPETMIEFLAGVRAEFGSSDDLAAFLGATEAVTTLRERLLEAA
jgi:protein-tyrosine phosphatase